MTEPTDGWNWPDLGEPELVDRLLLDPDDFHELWLAMVAGYPKREFTPEAFSVGTGYPWPRPDGSFVLSEGEGRLLADLEAGPREELLRLFTGPESGRTPMLAIGSNGSPEGLWRKFSHFPDPADRTLLAISGRLHDFDVCASAELALYGALPATLCPSPGTRVAATAVWLTPAQLTQLAWAEIPYWLGRIDTRFEFEPALVGSEGGGFDRCLVFVNRFGAFAPEGSPIALSSIPAEGRAVEAMDQVRLLEVVAELALGPGASPEDLVRAAYERPEETGPRVTGTMGRNALPFESDRWTPYPGPV